jgi:hypothetical protein
VVTSIKPVGVEKFYDLQVPYAHHYYAEGFIHHNSGKSDSFGGNVLTDWYAHSSCTTVLVSSTDLKSLELRIWGMIKKYHKAVKSEHPWMPGYLIEGRQMLTLDPREECEDGRDFKNGIIAVACKKGNQFVGLGPLIGIHNKRVRLLADECFPAGTPVNTTMGTMPIEWICPGDTVMSAIGPRRVTATSRKLARSLVLVSMADGRQIRCTPEHPFLTQVGWVKAIDLNQTHYIPCVNETLRILQETNAGKEQAILRAILQREMDAQPAGNQEGERRQDFQGVRGASQEEPTLGGGSPGAHDHKFSNEGPCKPSQDVRNLEAHWAQTLHPWRERHWPNCGGEDSLRAIPRSEVELCDHNRNEAWQRIPAELQGGPRVSDHQAWGRGGRGFALFFGEEDAGQQESGIPSGAWVGSVQVLESGHNQPDGLGGGYTEVFNLSVEGHPSYSVNGLIVHNCNLMPRAFLDAASNLSKCEDFKLVGLGNPNETTNAHGFLCEPSAELGGWEGGIDQTPGTKTWKTRFPNGICIQLPGSDSPNMKAPEGEPPPFPFLITRQQMHDDALIWGKDDWHFTMMNEAKMPRGQGSRRVLTRQACVKFGAFKEPNWRDSRRTKIAFLDAAYRGVGGDRCVFGELQFGMEAEAINAEKLLTTMISQKTNDNDGRTIIALIDLVTIPISSAQGADSPEDQIVKFVMESCNARDIIPENFYFDAGMRTSLVTAFSRLWSPQVQSVDCGARPSEDAVSSEIRTSCRDYYSKFVTELWFSVRMAVESGQFRGMTEEAATEFSQREWKMVSGNRIEIESKEDMKLKTGRSPDLADAVAVGLYGARKKGFVISKLARPLPSGKRGSDWRDELRKKAQQLAAAGRLNFKA